MRRILYYSDRTRGGKREGLVGPDSRHDRRRVFDIASVLTFKQAVKRCFTGICPMFVEKPLGITGKESLDMAAAIERANYLFTTGYFMRTEISIKKQN